MDSVYQFGTFDVPNYGDLLFPLLAQKRLAKLNTKITCVSPIGSKPVWSDCFASIGIDEIENIAPSTGILIGGGNIITLFPTRLPAYNHGFTPLLGYSDMWVGASNLAMEGSPICWNAPGVQASFPKEQWPLVRDCIERSAYVSVRDELSRDCLLETYPDANISVVPDPAWEISNLWTKEDLSKYHEMAFVARGNKKKPNRSIVIHLNFRYLASASLKKVAGYLDKVSTKMDAQLVLIAIGPCHGDDEIARLVGKRMKTNPLIVDQPSSLKEIAGCIAHAEAYVGSSMHGLITASSFGVPGICVVTGNKIKFQGLKTQFNQNNTWSQSWEQIPKQLYNMDMDEKRNQLHQLRHEIQNKIDKHWDNITAIFQKHGQCHDKVSEKTANDVARQRFASYRTNLVFTQAMKYFVLYEDAKKVIRRLDKGRGPSSNYRKFKSISNKLLSFFAKKRKE